MNLKVSIIICVLNGEKSIYKTVESILNQDYLNLELIIIDGGSSDNTIEIIKSFYSSKIKWISEPDKGISDAFNKGIKLATGDYINFQGDGDGFINSNSISDLFINLDLKQRPIVCGNIQRIDINGNLLYKTKIKKRFDKKSLLFKMSLPHQGLFIPKEFFAKYGEFDLNNKYCMDYELLLRSYNNFPKVITKDLVVSNWRADGLGEGKTLEILKEYHKIKLKNKVACKPLLVVINIYSFFKYYLKSFLNFEKS
ncbi:glycosyltransferase [Flavobacteriaceae bacterium]|nr:glycosyltransferase [Flavobacteriaceae bacterium]